MLTDFFKLNSPSTTILSQSDFLNSLRTTNSLMNFLYQPDELQPEGKHPKLKFNGITFTNGSFSKTIIKNVIFTNCKFIDCLFIGSTIENCEIHDCVFESVNTHKIEIRKSYLNPDNFSKAITDKSYSNIAVHLFQKIYDNLRDNDQPLLASEAEFYFRNWERVQLIQKWKQKKIDYKTFFKKIIPRQLHFFVGYGIRFSIFFFTYFLFLTSFGIANYFLWDYYNIKCDLFQCGELHTPIHVAYFTFYTSTSLGAGEMFPQSDFGILMSIMQSIIGYIFIGVFLSMLIKKIVK